MVSGTNQLKLRAADGKLYKTDMLDAEGVMLKRSLKKCVDWSQIDKNEYLAAMRESVSEPAHIKALVESALTSNIDDREMFMKGIDYSYYYEQND